MFSCEFCEISKNTFFTEQLWASFWIYQKYSVKKCMEICGIEFLINILWNISDEVQFEKSRIRVSQMYGWKKRMKYFSI